MLASIAGAATLSFVIKGVIERPRPELSPHSMEVYTSSFPSGHATGAAATYLTLGALLARFQRRRRLKVYLLTLAVILTVMIGLSRLYLGVTGPRTCWQAGRWAPAGRCCAGWWRGSCSGRGKSRTRICRGLGGLREPRRTIEDKDFPKA